MLPEPRTEIPGPRSRALASELSRHESRNVTFLSDRFPVFWQHAEGANVWDADGNRFLDLTSAFGVAGWGHGHPHLVQALQQQAKELFHAMGDVHPSPHKAALCRRLSQLTFERWNVGEGRTILGNSGFEAVEAALKTAALFTGKPGVITFEGAYHGLGFGALDTCGLPFFRRPFEKQLGLFSIPLPYPYCFRCPFGNKAPERGAGDGFPACADSCLEQLKAQIRHALQNQPVGAILTEPIQGRGGEVFPPLGFLPMLREVCDETGTLLILDEIYTGFFRTGKLFACDHSKVVPDLLCLGKTLTGGYPLSACVGRSAIMDAWPESQGEALHTSTFLGNPVGCRMALASLDLHENELRQPILPEHADRLRQRVSPINAPVLAETRGTGFLYGLELVRPDGSPAPEMAAWIVDHALQDGLILLGGGRHGNVLSLSPPYLTESADLEFALGRLQEYLTSLPGSIS